MMFAKYNKLWVALSGFVATAIALGLLEGPASKWASCVISAVTAAGVFGVPNKSDAAA